MKNVYFLFFLCGASVLHAQQTENLIIVTTDGFRWQEVFSGIDKAIADNSKFNKDEKTKNLSQYCTVSVTESRKKLMPFFMEHYRSERTNSWQSRTRKFG